MIIESGNTLLPKLVVAIRHKARKGKSETCRHLANEIFRQYPNTYTVVAGSVPNSGDFTVVLNVNGKVVVIISKGDPWSDVAGRLNAAMNYNPDLIYCTCRTSGETFDDVKVVLPYGFEIVWDSTYWHERGNRPENRAFQTTLNQIKGKHLLGIAQSLNIL